MIIGNIILGLLLVALGVWTIWKAYFLQHSVFPLSWVERKFGRGMGTHGYQLIGFLCIIFGLITIFGFFDTAGSLSGPQAEGPVQNTQQTQQQAIPSRDGIIAR